MKQSARVRRAQAAMAPLVQRLYRYRRLVPVASFAAGLASFFLVERQAQLAQWLTAGLFAGWLWLLGEGLFHRWASRWFGERLPPMATRFGAQALHQEALFFVLPFFLVTTTWFSGQIFFTGMLIVAAILSIIDPVYMDQIAARRWLFFAFHAFSLFAALLVALPIMFQLTVGDSLALATVAMMIFALPSIAGVLDLRRTRRWVLLLALTLALGGFAWFGRTWIPPATLRVTEGVITYRVDAAAREPGRGVPLVPAQRLSGGLYAFTAIKAPRGLHQPVLHVWEHDGQVVDRIRLHIVGGRAQGYRAWSHKSEFPADSGGLWRVLVKTADGQLIGVLHFKVV
ncbi:MAG: DUF2914 domain-containing protein [Salinisphaera sp.]|nr:DUF2914 domain-containing protein [Salinisphaera sp.]